MRMVKGAEFNMFCFAEQLPIVIKKLQDVGNIIVAVKFCMSEQNNSVFYRHIN